MDLFFLLWFVIWKAFAWHFKNETNCFQTLNWVNCTVPVNNMSSCKILLKFSLMVLPNFRCLFRQIKSILKALKKPSRAAKLYSMNSIRFAYLALRPIHLQLLRESPAFTLIFILSFKQSTFCRMMEKSKGRCLRIDFRGLNCKKKKKSVLVWVTQKFEVSVVSMVRCWILGD